MIRFGHLFSAQHCVFVLFPSSVLGVAGKACDRFLPERDTDPNELCNNCRGKSLMLMIVVPTAMAGLMSCGRK